MKKYCNDSRTVNLTVYDKIAIVDFNERGVLGRIAFDKYLLDKYAEDYIKEHFDMSEKDGWIRRIESDESKI